MKTAQCIASMFECIVEGRLRGEGIWRLNMVFDNDVELRCMPCFEPCLVFVLVVVNYIGERAGYGGRFVHCIHCPPTLMWMTKA